MDSSASAHITNDPANIDHAHQSYGKNEVIVGNGEKLVIKHTRSSSLPCKSQKLKLNGVLHAPQVTKNLISVSRLTSDDNILVEFDSLGCCVKDKATGKILLRGTLKEGLYEFQNRRPQISAEHNIFSTTKKFRNTVFTAVSNSCDSLNSIKHTWHVRLGHPSDRVLNQVLKDCNVKFNGNESVFCEPCQFGKNHTLPFNLSTSRAKFTLELIHIDVWGPSPMLSTSGFKYYIQFLDDFSRYCWIYPLKNKSDALAAFVQF